MVNKLKIWNEKTSWESAEAEWERGKQAASLQKPLKGLKQLPLLPGITKDTAKNLKWKSLKWMITRDHKHEIKNGFFKHPLTYAFRFLRSIFKKKPYKREGDFFLYGIDSMQTFERLLQDKNNLFVLGFSYCHKPFECPSQRFTPDCIHDAENPVCRQCFIGKAMHAFPEKNAVSLIIPTIHYIGGEILKIIDQHPKNKIIFIITACEMTLEMFGDFGNMAAIQGIGVRLDGRICNTMRAFELSEQGVKPGLTVVLEDTQKKILELLRKRKDAL